MRGSRGAWMRFPDVCAIPVSFNARIAVSHGVPTAGERNRNGYWIAIEIHTHVIIPPGSLPKTVMLEYMLQRVIIGLIVADFTERYKTQL